MGNEELVALAADARSRLGTDLPCRTHNKLGYVGYQAIIIGQQQLQRGSLKVNEAEQGNGSSQCHRLCYIHIDPLSCLKSQVSSSLSQQG